MYIDVYQLKITVKFYIWFVIICKNVNYLESREDEPTKSGWTISIYMMLPTNMLNVFNGVCTELSETDAIKETIFLTNS